MDNPTEDAMRLVVEFQGIVSELSSGRVSDLENLLIRRTVILKDLLYYRHYGFRFPQLEALISSDPAVYALSQRVVQEEEDANAITVFQDRSATSTSREDDQGVDAPGSNEGSHYQGFRRARLQLRGHQQ